MTYVTEWSNKSQLNVKYKEETKVEIH